MSECASIFPLLFSDSMKGVSLGMRGCGCSCCRCRQAPTAHPLSALIKVKEAGLICMADGAHSTLYRGAAGDG